MSHTLQVSVAASAGAPLTEAKELKTHFDTPGISRREVSRDRVNAGMALLTTSDQRAAAVVKCCHHATNHQWAEAARVQLHSSPRARSPATVCLPSIQELTTAARLRYEEALSEHYCTSRTTALQL